MEVPAANRFLQPVTFSPLGLAVLHPWSTSGWEQKWKDRGSVSCTRAQVRWSDFLMNTEARDLKGRSRFTERLAQYSSGLLNPECAGISVP
jgi:hypothetical protein